MRTLLKRCVLMSVVFAGCVLMLNGASAQGLTYPVVSTYSATALTGVAGGSEVEQTASSYYPQGNTCTVKYTVNCSAIGPGGLATVDILEAAQLPRGSSVNYSAVSVNPSITVIATAAANSGAQATAALEYYFDVTAAPGYKPATPNASVSYTFSGAQSFSPTQNDAASEGLNSVASASVTIYQEDGTVVFSTSDNGSFSQHLSIDPNVTYEVEYLASASAGNGSTARATIDPLLTIDPSFAQDYNINYSSNLLIDPLGSPSPVPETSTWTMMLAGFAGLGFLGYRQTGRGRLAA